MKELNHTAEVRPANQQTVKRIHAAIKQADKSSWEVADGFLELSQAGWTQRQIADEFHRSQTAVCKAISCARKYSLPNNRPTFWEAYQQVDGHASPPVEEPIPEEVGEEYEPLPPSREPGDDTEAIEAEKREQRNNGKPTFDDRKVTDEIGRLTRLFNDRATALSQQKAPGWSAVRAKLNDLLKAWHAWQKEAK